MHIMQAENIRLVKVKSNTWDNNNNQCGIFIPLTLATSNMSATLTSSSVLDEAFIYICQQTVRLRHNSVVTGFAVAIYSLVSKFRPLGLSVVVGDSVICDSGGWEPVEWTMLSDVFCHLFQLPEQAFVLVHLLRGPGVSGCICCGCFLPTSLSSWHLKLDTPEVV